MALTQARSRASFQARLLLHLSDRRRRQAGSAGFTLVELMIVVAILGILGAVALPNYLQARGSAAIVSRVSEAVSFAKACAVHQSTGVGTAPNNVSGDGVPGSEPANDGVAFSTACTTTGGVVTAKWGTARSANVKCLTVSSASTSAKAVLTIAPNVTSDQIVCEFKA